jgi:hypothetical protein
LTILVIEEMVLNFLDSRATINYFFQNNDIILTVIDYGILPSIDHDDQPQSDVSKIVGDKIINFFEQRLDIGTPLITYLIFKVWGRGY